MRVDFPFADSLSLSLSVASPSFPFPPCHAEPRHMPLLEPVFFVCGLQLSIHLMREIRVTLLLAS